MGKASFYASPKELSVQLLPGSQALTIERTPDYQCMKCCPMTRPFMLKPPQVTQGSCFAIAMTQLYGETGGQ